LRLCVGRESIWIESKSWSVFYEGEFDDTKTDAGRRSVPLDSHGILRGVLDAAWQRSKHRNPGDLVFTNAKGGPVNRRNLLRRQLKPTIKKLGLPASTDFRSFRTMHSSLMSSIGVRPEVTRDNMGHANLDVTQNVYNRTWWEERVEAVSMAAATVWRNSWRNLCRQRECKSFWKSSHSRRFWKLLI
jgi:integrase